MKCARLSGGIFASVLLASLLFTPPASAISGGREVRGDEAIAKVTARVWIGFRLCTATILDDDIAITNAECVLEDSFLELSSLRFGINPKEVVHKTEIPDIEVHPEALKNAETDLKNIAVIRFGGGLPPGYYKATIANVLPKNSQTANIAGYGSIKAGSDEGVGVLRTAVAALKDHRFSPSEVLIDQRSGAGACERDNGAVAYTQQGEQIQVWGIASNPFPYTITADQWCNQDFIFANAIALKPWIESAIEKIRGKAPHRDK